MKFYLTSIATFLFVLSAATVRAAPINYDLLYTSGANTLSGTIQTDGTIGNIFAGNILSWTFTRTGGIAPFSISSTDIGAGDQCLGATGCYSATATTLTFNFDSVIANDPFVTHQAAAGSLSIETSAQTGLGQEIRASDGDPSFPVTTLFTGSTASGFAHATAVPVPAAFWLFSSGLIGLIGVARGKVQA